MKSVKNMFKPTLVSLIFSGLLMRADICPADFNKDKVDAFIRNAETYSSQGNYAVALNLYNQAINMYPGNMELYYKRAFVWGRTGQYGRALKDLSMVINSAKGSFPDAVQLRADCFMVLGYYQKAVADYLEFLRNHPTDGKVWSYLVEAYALMGQKQLALQAVKKGLATKSHWSGKLKKLQMEIMLGKKIKPHRPLSN